MSKTRSCGGGSMIVLMERFPYRYVEAGTLENGKPDFRIQKQDHYTMQLDTAIEDFEYTKWLDPDGVPAYRKNS